MVFFTVLHFYIFILGRGNVLIRNGVRIRICMDLHLLELLDPDLHLKCGPDSGVQIT
jgi:hypothetical protein